MIWKIGRYTIATTLIWMFCMCTCALAQTKNSADEQLLREQARAYAKSFAAGDAHALATMWTADGIFVDIEGSEYRGQHRIERYFTDYFRRAGAQPLAVAVEQISFPNTETAIEQGTTRLVNAPTPSISRYVAVHVRQNGRWQMASVTETPYRSANTSYYLRDLNWLIGSWTSQAKGKPMRLNAEWIANRNYIKCTYRPGGASSEEHKQTQLIGYNPLRHCIVSWHFGSSGGFGYSEWMKSGKKYIEQARMVEPDGTKARATNLITLVDSNNFTWRSTDRVLGGSRLPDTEEVKIIRSTDAK
jgi:uncharacterized protein (TIGR02246 family)